MFKLLFSLIFFISLNNLYAVEPTESDIKFNLASKSLKNKNYIDAIEIFEELSLNGEHDAQYNLALLRKAGKGFPQDYKSSLKWAWLSLLGNIPQSKELVNDLKKILPENALNQVRSDVLDFLKTRAENGNKDAIQQMGDYYLIVPEEPEHKLSYLWFLISAAFQIEGSLEKRDSVEKEIEPKDIINVQSNAKKVFEEITKKNTSQFNESNQVNKLEEIKNED